MKAFYCKRNLIFKSPAGTSRGIMLQKPSWYLFLEDEFSSGNVAIGECSLIPGLSIDDESKIDLMLDEICQCINSGEFDKLGNLYDFPCIQFGLETALLDYQVQGSKVFFPSDFTKGIEGIPINGLIWMDDDESIYKQIKQKLEQGFHCIKLKIGKADLANNFKIIRELRNQFSENNLEIRTDANGAYNLDEAKEVLKTLSTLKIHSIEQPIQPDNHGSMAELCSMHILPVALDEEIIGVTEVQNRLEMLEKIKPQYLILKPSLIGGLKEAEKWIELANRMKIGWWVTSALESNIGLNAIAQWTYSLGVTMPQGLGTGSLYKENIISPLSVKGEKLFYLPDQKWNFEFVY